MKVSVIIPCYNRAPVVAETIRCVLGQTLPPDEVIVVDDGSTDHTVAVLESFGSKLKVLRQNNAGPSAARNTGLAAAKGQFIWFMDSDDLASLNKLQTQVGALEQSGADMAIAPWIKCRLSSSRAYPQTHVLQQKGLPNFPARALVCGWTMVLQSALFRRSLLQKTEGFDPTYMVAEDQLLFLKCLLAGAKVVHTPECLVIYRTEGVNKLTHNGCATERRFVDWARFLLEGSRLCRQNGIDLDGQFSFRLRLWEAGRDLMKCDSADAHMVFTRIASVLGNGRYGLYSAAQKGRQWLGGIRQRVIGDRSPLPLRAGPIRPEHTVLFNDLGIILENAST